MTSGDVGEPAPRGGAIFATRLFGWANIAVLTIFVLNVFLNNAAGFPGPALLAEGQGSLAWIQMALYPLGLIIVIAYVIYSPGTLLRVEGDRFSAINNFLIRAAFWGVLFVGLVDITITFLRVEGFLPYLVGEELTRELGRSQFRGTYVHLPLLISGVILAAFTRTLGFIWLSLLIVIAELLIVFSRFIFAYEQAFMGDLVRFWYGALFLFASAYTLVEEGHVRVDVFYASFRNTTKGMVNSVGTLTMGIVLCWTILIIGMGGPASIINAPVFRFEITQQAAFGLYVKYMMAGFLGVFAISMLIQFVGYLMYAVADWRGDPGHVEHESVSVA